MKKVLLLSLLVLPIYSSICLATKPEVYDARGKEGSERVVENTKKIEIYTATRAS
jgi:cytochrome c oxidase assembly protein Cox11